ncbi:hypothetical protein THRCLA_09889 [Thraustotheca clavata]|uniref:Uncharacterized protein n=1 Tax=Thraustotheca clavata TaxID=74557 RepID=A0A1V9YTS8_9STRA|nr:hypothetical protein THRCLA_09889 [Thraustotheca clavata]
MTTYEEAYTRALVVFQAINPSNQLNSTIAVQLTDLQSLCHHLSIPLNDYELAQAMYDLDTTGEMQILIDDFVKWWVERNQVAKQEEEKAAITRLWEHVIELDGYEYFYDYITGEAVNKMPEIVEKIMAHYSSSPIESMDEKLINWFQKYDIDNSKALDADEWNTMMVAIGIPVPSLSAVNESMEQITGKKGTKRITYDELHKFWYLHAPQRKRQRLEEFPQWTITIDEKNDIFYTNDTTQISQWHHPALPLQFYTFSNQSSGKDENEKMEKLFVSLDVDQDIALNVKELHALLKTLGYTNFNDTHIKNAIMRYLEPGYEALSKSTCLLWWQQLCKKAKLGDWEEYIDANGQTYYYNPLTQQSQWEPPQVTENLQALLDKFSSDSTVTVKDKIRRLFQQYDTDNTGTLDSNELRRICAAMGQSLDATDMEAMVKAIDTSGDGLVNLEEFQNWWLSKQSIDAQWEETKEIISRAEEIRQICASYFNIPIAAFLASPFDSNIIPRLVQALGRVCRGKALLEALRNLDPNGTHTIEPNSFVEWYIEYEKACIAHEKRLREEERAQDAIDTWIEDIDEIGGKIYVNSRTNEKMWEKPGIQQEMKSLQQSLGTNDIRVVFARFDEDNSGSINAGELKRLLMALGQSVDDNQLQKILSIIDISGDGVISLEELTTWWVCMQRRSIAASNSQALASQVINYHAMTKESIKELRKLFDQFDTDHSGSIDEHELKHLLARLNWFPSDEDRHRLMMLIDTSGDGQIDLDEFIAWWVTVHRELEIKKQARANGHLLADAIAASNSSKQDTSMLAAIKNIDFAEVSLSNLKNKLSDFRYRLLAPKLDDLSPAIENPEIYEGGRTRIFGTVNVTSIHHIIVDTMRAIIDDVVLITPLMLPDAAQRIQKMYRAKVARRQLIQVLNDRYVHHIDPITGGSYYLNRLTKEIRFDKPLLLGDHEILTPRTALRDKHTRIAMRRRRLWLEKAMPTAELQARSSYRTAAFFMYDVLCNIKSRLLKGVWSALLMPNHTLAQCVVRRYPRQLKRLGPHGDYPLHYAIRKRLPAKVIITFLDAHYDVITLTNASGHTPLHVLARDPHRDDNLLLLDSFLNVPLGITTCTMVTKNTNLTPLHLAIHHQASIPFLERLMKASPEAFYLRSLKFEQPIHLAIRSTRLPSFERVKIVKLCIALGSPLHQVTENARALHHSLVWEAEDAMVNYLLDVEPEVVTQTYRRLLPLFLAMKHSRSEDLLRRMLKITVEKLQLNEIKTHKSFNPLHYALLYRLPSSFVLHLLQTNENWAMDLTYRQEHPLHLAAMYNDNLDVTKSLLKVAPFAARQINHFGCLPLHLAVLRGAVPIAKALLDVCPWVLLDKIKGKRYDALLLASKSTAKFPNSSMVDLFLFPPPLAPRREKYKHLELTPYYVAATSRLTTVQTFDKLHILDQCNTDDLEAIARKKLRDKHHKPNKQWEISNILALMARNPIDAAIQLRSLLALNQKVSEFTTEEREACIETYDIVRTIQYTMYDFSSNPRIQILGQACLNHLLPTPFAKAKYQSRVDPLYKF